MSKFDSRLEELRAARDVVASKEAAREAAQADAARAEARNAHIERITPSLTIYATAMLNVANMHKSLDFISVFGEAEATFIDGDRIQSRVSASTGNRITTLLGHDCKGGPGDPTQEMQMWMKFTQQGPVVSGEHGKFRAVFGCSTENGDIVVATVERTLQSPAQVKKFFEGVQTAMAEIVFEVHERVDLAKSFETDAPTAPGPR